MNYLGGRSGISVGKGVLCNTRDSGSNLIQLLIIWEYFYLLFSSHRKGEKRLEMTVAKSVSNSISLTVRLKQPQYIFELS